MVEVVEEPVDVELGHPAITTTDRFAHPTHRLRRAATRTEPERTRQEPAVEHRADHRQGGLLHHPVSDRGHPQRAYPPVRFGDLDPPHRRRDIAFRRQQPPAQTNELMLDVRTERCDRLAVDPGRARVRPDFRPCSCEVRRDRRWLPTADPTVNPSALSRSPRIVGEPGCQPPHPARRSEADPNHCSPNDTRFAAWSRSGPFTGHRRLLNGGPLTHILAVSHRALPRLRHYYEPV